MRLTPALAVLCLAGAASAQPLYGVDFSGGLYSINTATGAASFIGATGFDRLNSAAMNSDGDIYATRSKNPSLPADSNLLIRINSVTGAAALVANWGSLHDIRGLAFAERDLLFGIQDNNGPDQLVLIELPSGNVVEMGMTGRSDLQGLTSAPGPGIVLYAVGINAPGRIYSIDFTSGAATALGGAVAGDNQCIEFAGGTSAYAARVNLLSVNLITGITTTIGPLGISDLRGMAGFRPDGVGCYANCDGSTTAPILNVLDFSCFLNKFAAGDHYANCDQSTTPPVLNVLDFSCFLNSFAAGCS